MTQEIAKHTAGEWLVNPVNARVELAGADAPICALLWPTDLRSEAETFANARLIAASPELLSALKAIDDVLTIGIMNAPDGALGSAVADVRAAIQKATGA